MKSLDPNWQVTVQRPQLMPDGATVVPGFVQFDDVHGGRNHWSKGPEALRAEGYQVPDFSGVAQGRYRVGTLINTDER